MGQLNANGRHKRPGISTKLSLTIDQHKKRTKKQQRQKQQKKEGKQSRAAAARIVAVVVVGIANLSANAIGICNEYLNKRTPRHTHTSWQQKQKG